MYCALPCAAPQAVPADRVDVTPVIDVQNGLWTISMESDLAVSQSLVFVRFESITLPFFSIPHFPALCSIKYQIMLTSIPQEAASAARKGLRDGLFVCLSTDYRVATY